MSRPHNESAEAILVKVENMSGSANRIIMLLIALVHAVLANREVLVEVRDELAKQSKALGVPRKYSDTIRGRLT